MANRVSLWAYEDRDASGAVYIRQTFWHNAGASWPEAAAWATERWSHVYANQGLRPSMSVTRLLDNVSHADAMLRAGEEVTFCNVPNYGGFL